MAITDEAEVSSTSTTRVTKTTTVRRSTERSASPARSRSRSPSRRRALNRSPSPHRYNTRNNELSGETVTQEELKVCSVKACLSGCCGKLRACLQKTQGLVKDLVTCCLYVILAYIADTMCTYGKCEVRIPQVPKLSLLYNESVMLEGLFVFFIQALLFSIPIGQTVKGVPTDRGTLNYLCNAPVVLLLNLVSSTALYKYDPSLVEVEGNELQRLFAGVILIVVTAVCLQWKFASLGAIYNVAGGIALLYLADKRFNLIGQPAVNYSSLLLIWAMCLICYSLFSTLFKGINKCAAKAASRGLLLLTVTWMVSHHLYTIPKQACLVNTGALVSLACIALLQVVFIIRHRECAKACSLIILLVGAVAGILLHKKYLVIPSTCPYNSLWFVFNIGSAIDALFVLASAGWKTDFFGVKPVDFVTKVFKGDYDPRFETPLGTFDLKFFCIRVGLLCPLLFCFMIGVERYEAKTLTCPVTTILTMTILYSSTKFICLEKAITSQSEIVDQRCSVGMMLWALCAHPALILLPLNYVRSMPGDSPALHDCCYVSYILCATFILGLVIYATATLQGHYLLLGEQHSIIKSITTLAAGDEKIPVSGLWRFMRYPFITGELMVVASLALSTGFEGPLVYLSLGVQLVRSLYLVYSYNKLSPSFYGARPWKEYQQMVRYNIIPGIW